MQTLKKQELRAIVKAKVAQLSQEYCQTADTAIFRHVIDLPEYQQAKTIFCYVGTAIEIDTMPILQDVLQKEKTLVFPQCVDKGIMEAYQIHSLTDLQPGKYGILEPVSSCFQVEPATIDLCLIPCLACSKGGKRLGYGGGYYDRYLKRADFLRVALCRAELLVENIPVDTYDVKVDIVISERM